MHKGALFNTQYDMCDMVYRKLHELMLSVHQLEIDVEIKEIGKYKLLISLVEPGNLNIIYLQKTGAREHIGYIPMKKISLTELEDPFIVHLCKRTEFLNSRPELYTKWFNEIKNIMQTLLNEEKKYETIRGFIRDIPIFSPTRKVLIEKNN